VNAAADRNLLFGILALQLDFIRRDDLIAAMHAWVLDKGKPLGQILVEQQALQPDRRELLEALVRAHLEQHGNDPQRSLAGVSSVGPIRSLLQQIADPVLHASLAHVTPDRPEHDPYATTAEAAPGTARYRVLRPHARGGLGEVFVARDGEIDREVALKEIQARYADDPESRARFLLEAQVTGGLEHPGVVPVYGLGTYADGRPFYAMRFIRGDSLKEAIERFHQAEQRGRPAREGRLELRQLLGRFLDTCNAVEYAHSRGVLHRDLKPGNVMVGKYGETLVVDWGLAKVLDRPEAETTEGPLRSASGDSGMTQTGATLGTPAFMSPEQAAGLVDVLGPPSDVYSLGATLYALLTGRPPFADADAGAVLRRVQRGEFPRPRQVNRRVAQALEAVCLKAMALRPEERYPSPKALAGDVEHWLADEPVAAYREPLSARLGRWVRRHQTLATGVGALLLTAVIALAVSTLLVGQAQQQTAQALAQEKDARGKEKEARRQRAVAQVDTLLNAEPEAVPALLDALEPTREDVLPRLRQLWAEEERPGLRRGRVGLALLPVEPDRVRDWLAAALLREEDPREMVLLRDGLAPHAAGLRETLWARAAERAASAEERFRALVALAAFDAKGKDWPDHADFAADQMLRSNPLHLGTWEQALRPVGVALVPPLAKVYREARSPERREAAATVLADYAAGQPELLADLLLDADAKQFAVLLPVLRKDREQTVARMQRAVHGEEFWDDPPPDPTWADPADGLRREVEAADGLLAERWALCQTLPLGRWEEIADRLRRCGYRPVRLRPWPQQGKVLVAAVWARDGRPFRAETGLTADAVKEHDAALQKEGLSPADVAGWRTPEGRRFAAVWVKPARAGEEGRLYADFLAAQLKAAQDVFKNDGFVPLTVQAVAEEDGTTRFCGVWGKGPAAPKDWLLTWDNLEDAHRGRVLLAEKLLVDASVTPARNAVNRAGLLLMAADPLGLAAAGRCGQSEDLFGPRYASVWHADPQREAAEAHGLTVAAHLQRCRELAAQGYRPASLAVADDSGQTVTASVWHRSFPPQERRERLARRQATAAVALLQLDAAEDAWPLYRHRPDPEARSQLVWRGGLLGLDPKRIVHRLDEEADVSARRALILALGEYTGEQLPAAVREPLTRKLLDWYRDDPDPGVHGAIEWLLRQPKEDPEARPLDWGQAQTLRDIDTQLKRRDPDGVRRWYVNGQGQTLALVPGPVEFRMGAPPWDAAGIADNETPHRRRIPRSFALGTRAVTRKEFERFLQDRPDIAAELKQLGESVKRYSPAPEGPMIEVTWYEAAQYCNWLSEQEGLPESEWCYPKHAAIKEGMKPYPDYLRRKGYRLPTEAEWEHACRAGTVTPRSYGASLELLPRYAWCVANSPEHAWPVGQKRPNDLGLFDVHGNTWTWCQDPGFYYPKQQDTTAIEDKEDKNELKDTEDRVLRGCSFNSQPSLIRSSFRSSNPPSDRNNSVGLRVARTYPTPDPSPKRGGE
jgi:formylglycine-generating enzyme required for sulfatase activity/tRNA A-37 threonylcarbamoyl transferase component Bud32